MNAQYLRTGIARLLSNRNTYMQNKKKIAYLHRIACKVEFGHYPLLLRKQCYPIARFKTEVHVQQLIERNKI